GPWRGRRSRTPGRAGGRGTGLRYCSGGPGQSALSAWWWLAVGGGVGQTSNNLHGSGPADNRPRPARRPKIGQGGPRPDDPLVQLRRPLPVQAFGLVLAHTAEPECFPGPQPADPVQVGADDVGDLR